MSSEIGQPQQKIESSGRRLLTFDDILQQSNYVLCDTSVSVGKKMAIIDEQISNKEEAKIWINQAIHTLHANRTTVPQETYRHVMKHLLAASQHLAANVSYKLAIDHLILYN